MKRYILCTFSLVFSLCTFSQSNPNIFVGLNPTDSISFVRFIRSDNLTNIVLQEAINKQKVSYTLGDIHPHIPNTHAIDKNKSVGQIGYQMSTDLFGALNVNIPIEIYPDPKGLSPEIAIHYSSLGTNGPLGMGWKISGLSNITRSHKNVYFDNKVEALIAGDKNSVFLLDGMRLIKTDETSSQITFISEQGNIKVIGYLTGNGNNIQYFKTFYPNGQQAQYGYHTSSSGEYLAYPITNMNDIVGNSISYEYEAVGGHYRIKKIAYGLQKLSVEFNYSTSRSDRLNAFNAGIELDYNYKLNSIITKYNANILRTYTLSYIDKGYVSTIEKINCTANNKSYNPLLFHYGDNQQVKEYRNDVLPTMGGWTYKSPSDIRATKAKFELGSDNDALITYPNKMHYYHHHRDRSIGGHSNDQIRNRYDGKDETILVNTDLEDPSLAGAFYIDIKKGDGFIDLFAMDLDENYGEEVIKINNTCSGNQETLKFKVYSYGILGSPLRVKYTREYQFPTTIIDQNDAYSLHPKYYFTGDFTGNGRNHILAVASHKPMDKEVSCKYYLFDLENDNILTQNTAPFEYNVVYPKMWIDDESRVRNIWIDAETAYNQSDKLFTFDFNGDGKTDVCHINDNGTFIYTLEKDDSGYEFVLLASYYQLKKSMLIDKDVLFGEFNGDGLLDFLVSPLKDSGNIWKIYYSTGSSSPVFVEKDISLATKTEKTRFFMHDMNSDGMSDLIEISDEVDNGKLTTYFISNGSYKGKHSCSFPENTVVVPSNIRNVNYYNNIISFKGMQINKFYFKNNDTKNIQLTGLIDSYGIISKAAFLPLNENSNYSKNSDAVFPYTNFMGGFITVSQIQSYLNNEKTKDIQYSYRNAVTHKQGLGFCGFSEIRSFNTVMNDYRNEIYDPYNYSVIKQVETMNTKENFEYSIQVAANKTKNVSLIRRTEQDMRKEMVSTYSYSYDWFGNPLTEMAIMGDGISSTTVSNKYHNINTDNMYLIGLLRERNEVKTRNNASMSFTTKNIYNDKYLLALVTSYVNNHKVSEEAYEYDTYMNLKEARSRAYNSNWQTTAFEYDAEGRIKKETDPLGLYMESFYDNLGRLYSTKNHKGHTTSYEYDDWGKIIKVTHPDGRITENIFEWTNFPSGALNVSTERSSGNLESKIFYDALGREIRKGAKRYNGDYLYTDFIYNARGQVEKTSLPFKTNPTQWNEYIYDYYNRLTSIEYASGRINNYSYDKMNVNVTSVVDSITSTKTYDATGLVIKVKDVAGSLTYNYRPDGQLSSVVAPGKITTRFGYDQYGRQIFIDDPSAGNKIIEYDAAGNIYKETDARGKSSIYLYDEYNRLIQTKVDDELSTAYVYNDDGQLESITSDNGYSRIYGYDGLLRLQMEKETVKDNKYLQKEYTYNSYGVLSAIKYSNQSGEIATENHIHNYGHLSEIKLNNTITVWKITGENDMGIATDVQTGILARKYEYDNFGLPTGRSVKRGNQIIQDFTYSFDATTNNLDYRVDNKRNIREDFQYDNLNRLTHFGNTELTYNSKGNIVKNSNIGRYQYNPAKPYAVEALNLYNEHILTSTQDIIYNALMRPASISDNGYLALLHYTAEGDRMKMTLSKDSANILTRYYVSGQYEFDVKESGSVEKLYLGGSAYTAAAVLVRENGAAWKVHYICRDYLGSITHITDDQGNLVQELSYSPWGRLRNPNTHVEYKIGEELELFLGRGYTGHEHLLIFGLINMNARLYDPVLGSFISPDPYVQAPLMTQNFNRYSYALNNPLRFTDASGELAFIPFLIVVGAAAVTGYVTYGIVTGNWGMKAVTAGLSSAAFTALGYFTLGAVTSVSAAWEFAAKDAANAILSQVIKPLDINLAGIGLANITITISPVAMFTAGVSSKAAGSGFRFGSGVSVSQKIGDWTITAGVTSQAKELGNIYGGFSYDDGKQGFSYFHTAYMSGEKQRTGTFGARSGDWSLRWENDVIGDKHDRFRSNATELGYKDYFIGTNVFTTDPVDYNDKTEPTGYNGSRIFNNKNGTYNQGKQLSSPLYIGKKTGNTIRRIGWNNPAFGDFFQNGFHHLKLPFIIWGVDAMSSGNFQLGDYNNIFYQYGTYTPWSLY